MLRNNSQCYSEDLYWANLDFLHANSSSWAISTASLTKINSQINGVQLIFRGNYDKRAICAKWSNSRAYSTTSAGKKNWLTIWPMQQSWLLTSCPKVKTLIMKTYATYIHCSTWYNNQNMKTTQMSNVRWKYRDTVVYIYIIKADNKNYIM